MSKPWTVIVEEGGKVRQLRFELDKVTIGRTNDNPVKISDALSSRHHCQIRRDGEGFLVEDLKSRNGTRLNGQPLTDEKVLSIGDRIEVGDTIIHFGRKDPPTKRLTKAEADARRAAAQKRSAASGPPVKAGGALKLRVLEGDAKGQVFEVAQLPFTAGRKKSNGLVLSDNDVSNEHCMIVGDGDAVHLVDLGSTNGTFVNNSRLKGRAPLREGSLIRLGATLTFRVETGSGGAAAAAAAEAKPRKVSARARKKGSARAKRPEKKAVAAAQAVEEVVDLDALDDDGPPSRATSPAPAKDSAELVAHESVAIPAVSFGETLEARAVEDRQAGAGVGVAVVVISLLLVLGAVGFTFTQAFLEGSQGDPAPDENLIGNWSFEKTSGAEVEGWELLADEAKIITGDEVLHGKRALALFIKPDTQPELRAVIEGVNEGKTYRVAAAVSQDPNTAVALRVDWLREGNPDWVRTEVAVLTEAASTRTDWREISGLVVAPAGADKARVACVALAKDGASGQVRFDRVRLQIVEEPSKRERVPGPVSGLELRVDPRGVLSIQRGNQTMAQHVGLVLDPVDPLTTQSVARLDQPLGRQTDESLLALGSIPWIRQGSREEYAFSARASSDSARLRWSLTEKDSQAKGPLHVAFLIEDLEDLGGLELDGQAVSPQDVAKKDVLIYERREEMVWGSGKSQFSFQLLTPADVTLRRAKGGQILLILSMARDEPNAAGQRDVGFDIQAASERDRAAVRRLLSKAARDRDAGHYAAALSTYERVQREYSGVNWVNETSRAKKAAAAIREHAQQRLRVIAWAIERARSMPGIQPTVASQLRAAAKSALTDIERGYPDSSFLRAARKSSKNLDTELEKTEYRRERKQVAQLFARAKSLHDAGRLRMARRVYAYLVEHHDPKLSQVQEAKRRLAGLKRGSQ